MALVTSTEPALVTEKAAIPTVTVTDIDNKDVTPSEQRQADKKTLFSSFTAKLARKQDVAESKLKKKEKQTEANSGKSDSAATAPVTSPVPVEQSEPASPTKRWSFKPFGSNLASQPSETNEVVKTESADTDASGGKTDAASLPVVDKTFKEKVTQATEKLASKRKSTTRTALFMGKKTQTPATCEVGQEKVQDTTPSTTSACEATQGSKKKMKPCNKVRPTPPPGSKIAESNETNSKAAPALPPKSGDRPKGTKKGPTTVPSTPVVPFPTDIFSTDDAKIEPTAEKETIFQIFRRYLFSARGAAKPTGSSKAVDAPTETVQQTAPPVSTELAPTPIAEIQAKADVTAAPLSASLQASSAPPSPSPAKAAASPTKASQAPDAAPNTATTTTQGDAVQPAAVTAATTSTSDKRLSLQKASAKLKKMFSREDEGEDSKGESKNSTVATTTS